MKKTVLLWSFAASCCNFFTCQTRSHDNTSGGVILEKNTVNLSVDTSRLSQKLSWYYDMAIKSKKARYELLFLKSFPNTFKQFTSLYSDEKSEIYNNEEHVRFFCKTSALDKEKFASKIVSIGINGYWEEDAVSLLQSCALNFTAENGVMIIKALNKYGKKDVKGYWRFIFDGPHPPKSIPDNIEKTLLHYPDMNELAKAALTELHLTQEKHGE